VHFTSAPNEIGGVPIRSLVEFDEKYYNSAAECVEAHRARRKSTCVFKSEQLVRQSPTGADSLGLSWLFGFLFLYNYRSHRSLKVLSTITALIPERNSLATLPFFPVRGQQSDTR